MRSIDRLVRSHGAEAIIKYLVSSRALQAEELYNIAAEIEEERIDTLIYQEDESYEAKMEIYEATRRSHQEEPRENIVTCERDDVNETSERGNE